MTSNYVLSSEGELSDYSIRSLDINNHFTDQQNSTFTLSIWTSYIYTKVGKEIKNYTVIF